MNAESNRIARGIWTYGACALWLASCTGQSGGEGFDVGGPGARGFCVCPPGGALAVKGQVASVEGRRVGVQVDTLLGTAVASDPGVVDTTLEGRVTNCGGPKSPPVGTDVIALYQLRGTWDATSCEGYSQCLDACEDDRPDVQSGDSEVCAFACASASLSGCPAEVAQQIEDASRWILVPADSRLYTDESGFLLSGAEASESAEWTLAPDAADALGAFPSEACMEAFERITAGDEVSGSEGD